MEILKDITLFLVAGLTLLMLLTVISSFFFAKVPYVPSRRQVFHNIFSHLPVEKNALFIDIGCGDGRMLFEAEKKGLSGIGYEIAPIPYLLARLGQLLRRSKTRIYFRNFYKQDLSQARYIYCYLFPKLVETAYQKISRECAPGTYFICNTFALKSVQPVKIIETQKQPALYIYQI